jgi:glycosyltransferase involved in cell wall biosynthesis
MKRRKKNTGRKKKIIAKGKARAHKRRLKKFKRGRLINRRRKRVKRGRATKARFKRRQRLKSRNELVSVIMPSFNQARFLRETIETVLNQDYPFVELIVVDGGSTDGSIDILNSYAHLGPQRFRFLSEPDRGQAHALNKGLAMANGTILGWLNSDDTYHPGAISKAVQTLRQHPDWAMVYGRANFINERSEILRPYDTKPFDRDLLLRECFICQPAAFLMRDVVMELGGLNETYQFCMDYDLWLRITKNHSAGYIDDVLANYRLHDASKTHLIWKDTGVEEVLRMIRDNYGAGTVAGKWVAEFATYHWPKGVFWLLNRYKANKVFGSSPEVVSIDRYEDGWVPNATRIVIRSEDPGNPIQTLLLKGSHRLANLVGTLHLRVFVNDSLLSVFEVPSSSFVLEIPIHNAVLLSITIQTVEGISLQQHGFPNDNRVVGFIAEEVMPLSAKEYEFYTAYNQHPEASAQWLLQHK